MKKIIYSQINRLCIDIPEGNIKNGQHLQIWEKTEVTIKSGFLKEILNYGVAYR